jgi:hypothetical protein
MKAKGVQKVAKLRERQSDVLWRNTGMPSVSLSASASAPVGSYCASPAELLRRARGREGEAGARALRHPST